MKLLVEHLPAALVAGLAGMLVSGDPSCIVAALIFGWMIDADHLVDYGFYAARAGDNTDLSFVRSGKYFDANKKVIVPLHAWEITVALAVLAMLIPQLSALLFSAAAAHGAHLFQDQVTNRARLDGYFIISRIAHGFDQSRFCAPGRT